MSSKVFSFYNKIVLGFAIAIAGFSYFLFSTVTHSELSISDSRKINLELRMMRSAERLLDDMQDIETATRGYAISGKADYLDPADRAMKAIPNDLWELLYSTSFDSSEKAITRSLAIDIHNELQLTEVIIKHRKANKQDKAFQLISTNAGVVFMTNIRNKIDSIEQIGRSHLNNSNAFITSSETKNKIHYLQFTLIIFLALVIIYFQISRDVRRQNISSMELAQAEEKVRDLYNSAPIGYLTINPDGTITQINVTALNWLDTSYVAIVNQTKLTDIATISSLESIQEKLRTTEVISIESKLKTKSGADFPVLLDASAKKDETGKPLEYRIVFIDIRIRKKAEERVNYLARLIEQTNDSIISTDQDLIIQSWNKGAERMYGFSAEEVIGQSYPSILKIESTPENTRKILEVISTNGNWTAEVKHYRKDGTQIYVENSVTVFNKESKDVFQLVTINQDITARKIAERKLKKLNRELIDQVEQKTHEITDIFQRISDSFVSIDRDGNIIYMNQSAVNFIGRPKEEILGLKFMDLLNLASDSALITKLQAAFIAPNYSEFEERTPRSNRWISMKCYPSPGSVSFFFQDITQRKINELKLIESEKKYRLLFENNPIPMWILDINTRLIIDVNDAAIQNYGYDREEFIGKSAYELREEDEQKKISKNPLRDRHDSTNSGYWAHKRKDGTSIVVEILAYTLMFEGKPCRLILANDVTEKIKFQEEIESSRDQLRQLSGYLEKVREEERTTIAREIHDELGQQLTGLKMDLSWLAKRINQQDEQKLKKVNEMLVLIDDTVATVRKIASELRPGILDDLGLIAALDWQSREFEKRTGVICRFNYDFVDTDFDKNVATGIFRIYQEALTNVARHASATEVKSFLKMNAHDCIEFTIIDNGIGIIQDLSSKKTLGLIGMKERALMMHGSLLIDSREGSGTKINLRVPIEN